MTITDMRYFVKVCEERNISTAAKKLFVTQQTLSMAIARLERELECKLLWRGGNGVDPTPQGIYLKEQYMKVLEMIDSAAVEIKEIGENGQIHIAVPAGMSTLFDQLSQSDKRYVLYYTVNESESIRMLRSGRCEAVISALPTHHNDFGVFPLLTEPLYICVGMRHPFYNSPKVTLDMLHEQKVLTTARFDLTYEQILRTFLKRGVVLKEKQYPSISLIGGLQICAKETNIITIFSESIARTIQYPGIRYIKIDDPCASLKYFLITREKNRGNRSFGFANQLLSCISQEHKLIDNHIEKENALVTYEYS